MSGVDVHALFRDVMSRTPAERLKLAGMLLETDPTKAEMALSIAKSACNDIEGPIVLRKLREHRP